MRIQSRNENLIFIISQPRAGSTLLQCILGSHPDIHTISEPWLMLHPFYALRSEGYEAEYKAHTAQLAVQGFLQALPGGEDDYFEGVRLMHNYLYERALAGSGKLYFLDKTPRYYFVIPELFRTFPEAHYMILLRNPIAVLCSNLKRFVREDWLQLYRRKADLVRAPRLLVEGGELLGDRGVIVHYERLVENPEREVRLVCDALGVGFLPEMIEYGNQSLPRWRHGDQEGVYEHPRPDSQLAARWVRALDDPQVWRLASDYLDLLGQETVQQMGYAFGELRQMLEAHRPHQIRLWLTFSLDLLLEAPVEERKWWVLGLARLSRSLRHRGIRGTVSAALRRIPNALSKPVDLPPPPPRKIG